MKATPAFPRSSPFKGSDTEHDNFAVLLHAERGFEQVKKFRTITLAVALTTALSFGATGALAAGTTGTLGTGTTTTSGYTGSNYDATTGTTGTTTTTGTMGTTGTTGTYTGSGTGTGSYSGTGTGTGVRGQINTYGNNMMDRMSTTGTNTGNYDTSSYRSYATTAADDNDMDWGWLGLIGLLGLAGLRGKDKRRDDVR